MGVDLQWLLNLSPEARLAYYNETLREQGYYRLRKSTAAIWDAVLYAFHDAGIPQTVRQVFYKLTTYGAVPKTENGYGQACYHLGEMREKNIIPYGWIADNTRWMRKPTTFSSIYDALVNTRETYRRALWNDQDAYVEVWCEKDALAGVLNDITSEYDIPLMVSRGYSSKTFAYEAAQELRNQEKPCYIYYFGDHDPSGQDARRDIKEKLERYGAKFTFEPVAVLPWQIEAFDLPTRPTKKTDSRSKNWNGDSVELDAIPADQLRNLCSNAVMQHIDSYELAFTKLVEKAELEAYEEFLNNSKLARDFKKEEQDLINKGVAAMIENEFLE